MSGSPLVSPIRFALWAWVQLLRLGVRARSVLKGLYSDGLNHAWVQIYKGGRVGVFECTPCDSDVVIPARNATEYRPLLSVGCALRGYRHAPDAGSPCRS